MNQTDLDLHRLLDEAKFGRFQVRVIAICFFIIALDGFDTQSIAFVAPALRDTWGVSPALFGPLFGAGLLGTLLGSIALGSLADRFGRKPLILFSTSVFGVMTLLCATATSIEVLGVYRFLAGLGLGGAVPNIIALISEYAPRRIRSTVIVATFAGFPLGAVVGGMVSARMIPVLGWESVFVLGGALPVMLIPVILVGIPESLRFLVYGNGGQEKIGRILSRIEPSIADVDASRLRKPVGTASRQPVRNLFTQGRAAWTMLLWLLTFTALLLAYFLVNWTPLILVDAGLTHHRAIMGVVALNLGGIIGSLVLGRISDKRGPFVAVGGAFGVGAAFVALVGLLIQSSAAVLLALIFVVGLCVFGAQLNIPALAANYYPIPMRSTGVGWSMGMGRLGSIIGPTVGGALVAFGLARGQLFLCAMIPAVVACLTVTAMSFHVPAVEQEGSTESS